MMFVMDWTFNATSCFSLPRLVNQSTSYTYFYTLYTMSSELSSSPTNLSLIPSSPLESHSPTSSSSTTMQSDTSEKGLLGSGAPTTAADQKHCSANPQAEGKINVDNHSTQTEFVGFWVPTFTPDHIPG